MRTAKEEQEIRESVAPMAALRAQLEEAVKAAETAADIYKAKEAVEMAIGSTKEPLGKL
jgi:hypothetical protein